MSANQSAISQLEYEALCKGVAILAREDASALLLRGPDRADFLHRMTTNEINSLRPGQSTVTILTSPTARIVFVFSVVCRPQDMVLLPAPGQTETLSRHLQGQIFFMDQVEVESLTWSRWRIMGPLAEEALTSIGWNDLRSGERTWWETEDALLVRQKEYDVPGFELAAATNAGTGLVAALQDAGAVILTSQDAYTARRVELGRPAPGKELTDQYNPLEAGMAWACAENKGCYTGQEIIARQLTYDKVTKTLAGLICDGPVSEGETVIADGTAVGQVTTATFSPAFERHLALAIVRRPFNAPETLATVSETQARIAELPFQETAR